MTELVVLDRQAPERTSTPAPDSTGPTPSPARGSDPRYGTRRWRRLAKLVLARDRFRCRIVEGCPTRASVADHIEPTTLAMPDALFYDAANLRAGCREHNLDRAAAANLEPAAADPSVVSGDYS